MFNFLKVFKTNEIEMCQYQGMWMSGRGISINKSVHKALKAERK